MADTFKSTDLSEDKERVEFDNITYERIHEIKDVAKLRRLEAYMRKEGFAPTADSALSRIRDLGSGPENDTDPDVAKQAAAALQAERSELSSWQASIKGKESQLFKQVASVRADTAPAYPAVRSTAPGAATPTGPAAGRSSPLISDITAASDKPSKSKLDKEGPKLDSQFGGGVRSGKDYYQKWDRFADQADKQQDDTAPTGAKQAAAAAATAAPVLSSGKAGPQLTMAKIRANTHLTDAELAFNSDNEKAKGNESFRAKEYKDAIECYTIALGFTPNNAALHANRAAAYIKAGLNDLAEQDCDSALALDPGHLKALVRRAACRLDRRAPELALQDIDAALGLDPHNRSLFEMRDKANKALGRTALKRMAIEEVSDEEEDVEVEVKGRTVPAAGVTAPAAAAASASQLATKVNEPVLAEGQGESEAPPPVLPHTAGSRTRIAVVEEEEEEDEEDALEGNFVIVDGGAVAAAIAAVEAAETRNVAHDGTQAVVGQPSAQARRGSGTSAPAPRPVGGASASGASPPAATATASAAPRARTQIQVVEDSDSDTGSEVSTAQSPAPPPHAAAPAEVASSLGAAESPIACSSKALTPPQARTTYAVASEGTRPLPAMAAAVPGTAAEARSAPPALAPGLAMKQPACSEPVAAPPPVLPSLRPSALPQTLDERVLELKEEGNASFKKSDFRVAASLYTEAIELAPAAAVLYQNRAMSRLRLDDVRGALRDSCTAVALDPTSHKALRKRAEAKQRLGHLQAAKVDLTAVHDMITGKAQEQVATELHSLEADIATAERKQRQKAAATSSSYKGGLTIVEEEDADAGATITKAQLEHIEGEAAYKVPKLQHAAEQRKRQWQEKVNNKVAAAATAAVAETAAAGVAATDAAAAEKAGVRVPPVAPAASLPLPAAAGSAASTDTQAAQPPASVKPSVEELKERGNALYTARDIPGALAQWSKCLEVEPANIPVHLNMAQAKNSTGDHDGALWHAATVLGVEPANTKALFRHAVALAGCGQLEASLEELRALRAKMGPVAAQVEEEQLRVMRLIQERDAAATAAGQAPVPAPAASAAGQLRAPAVPAVKVQPELGRPSSGGGAQAPAAAGANARAVPSCGIGSSDAGTATAAADSSQEAGSAAEASGAAAETPESLRLQGNEHFKGGDLAGAAHCYGRSIALKAENSVAYANRAQVRLLQDDLLGAEADARAALDQDPAYVKARHRLSISLRRQGRLEEALEQYKQLPADDLKVQAEVGAVRQQLALQSQQVPLQRNRIVIEETDSSGSDEEEAEAGLALASTPIRDADAIVSAAAEGAATTSAGHPKTGTAAAPQGGTSTAPAVAASSKAGQESLAAKAIAAAAALSGKKQLLPRSAVDFDRSTKQLASDPSALVEYVYSIPPESYRSVFKESLEAPMVVALVNTLAAGCAANVAFTKHSLAALAGVSRFDLILMQLKGRPREQLQEIFAVLEAAGQDVTPLRKKYRV